MKPLRRFFVRIPSANVAAEDVKCRNCGDTLQQQVDPAESDEGPPDHVLHAQAILSRAFRAAVIGIGLCPPFLHVYSLTKLMEYRVVRSEFEGPRDWRVLFTFLLDVAMIVGAFVLAIAIT